MSGYQHEYDPMDSMMVDVGTPGIDRGEDAYYPTDEYMPGVDDDEREPYRLHYVSADNAAKDSTWSVYVEEYEDVEDGEPIEASQQHVSTHATEAEAYAEADRLQALPAVNAARPALWVLVTVGEGGLVVTLHRTQADAYECLRDNFLSGGISRNASFDVIEEAMTAQPDVIWSITEEYLP